MLAGCNHNVYTYTASTAPNFGAARVLQHLWDCSYIVVTWNKTHCAHRQLSVEETVSAAIEKNK